MSPPRAIVLYRQAELNRFDEFVVQDNKRLPSSSTGGGDAELIRSV
jgi:hypothetical protein